MAATKTPWLEPGQEAPDPVEFAREAQQVERPEDESQAAPAREVSMAQALAMIADALKTIKAGDSSAGARLAGIEQLLLADASTRPRENLFNPPMVSVFNPDGERDHPRPELACRMIWVGYELNKEILSREEIDLLNQMEPGVYRVTKADGRKIRLSVAAKETEEGKREMLTFHFPCKDSEDRQNHQPMVAYLRECLGLTVTHEGLLAEVARLKAQLAAATLPMAA